MAIRRQQTSLRTVEAYHRALDTMGKLAAQQAGTPRPVKPTDPEHPYVRVVHDDEVVGPPAPSRPPLLRSRPRRGRQSGQPAPPASVPAPGPNTKLVVDGERPDPVAAPKTPSSRDGPSGPAPDDARPSRPVPEERLMLHFDAAGHGAAPADPVSTGAGVASGETVRAREPRPGPARRPTPPPRPRSGRVRRAWRHWRAAAATAALLLVVAAGIAGVRLALEPGTTGRPAPPTHPLPPGPVAAPTTVGTTPTPEAATALLVTSSVGSSTYHVDASATISFRATSSTCWVEIRQAGPTGPLLFEGDVVAGQSRALNGPVWVRLGNPTSIAVTVDGASLALPGLVAGQPYNLQFA